MAVIKFISDLRLLGGAVIEKARLENLPTSSAPASPALGQMYFDTTTQKVTVWATVSGTPQWVAVGTDAADITALETRVAAIENAPYASEGFVTGITDGHDTRITAIENAPYASEGYADSAASAAVDAHDTNLDAHSMGIKWFTPTQIINGDLSTTVAAQADVALSTSDTIVASFSAADPLGWLEFSGEITVDGTGSVTFDVEIQDDLDGVAPMGTLTVTRGVASSFKYMIQAPATGIAKDYDLVIRTQAGSETADFSIIDVDAFGSDPFVVRSELQGEIGALDTRIDAIENAPYATEGFVTGITDGLDTRIDAIENAPYVINADFTITGDAIETEFTSPNLISDVYPTVSVWENATGSLVLVDVTRSYNAGPDWTTLTISFNEAPADGATYRVAVKI